MERDDFFLNKFTLKNKQDVTCKYKHDGKMVTEEFTDAVHPALYRAMAAFEKVISKQTGLDPETNEQVASIEARTVMTFDGVEERSLMITAIIRWKGGFANSINTVKMPLSNYAEATGINIDELVIELENRAYNLLFKGELAHEQPELPLGND